MCASSGTGKEDFRRLKEAVAACPDIEFICLDVANGYSEHFVEFVKRVGCGGPAAPVEIGMA
jgi:GMP reductase